MTRVRPTHPTTRLRRLSVWFGTGLSAAGVAVALLALITVVFPGSAGASDGSEGAASSANSATSGGAACAPASVITAYHFTVNGNSVTTLRNNVQQGDSVEAFFTIAAGCTNIPVALVSHTMPDNTFVASHVSQQKVFDSAKGSFDAGSHTLGPINVPSCNYQVDFAALENHGQHGFTYSSAVGGTTACVGSPPAPTTIMCTSSNDIGVTLFPMSPPATETYTVTVTANGKTTTETVTVTDTAVTHTYPVPEDTSATITVTNSSGESILSVTTPHDCARPSASVSSECVTGTTGGVQVQATNEGSQPKTFTILKNGSPVAMLTVAPFSTGTTTVSMAEGESAIWVVSGPEGLSTTPLSVTNSCTQVMPIVITSPGPTGTVPNVLGTQTTLPVTGANTVWLFVLAAGLVAAGVLLLVVARTAPRPGGSHWLI